MNFKELFSEGAILVQQKAYPQASIKFTEALNKATPTVPKMDIITCHMQLAETFYRQVIYQKSLQHFEQAFLLSKELNDELLMARIWCNKSILYKDMGEYQKAITFLYRSAKVFERYGDQKRLASNYSTMGNVFIRLQKYSQAIDYHLKAMKINQQLKLHIEVAKSKNNLANAYLKKGNLKEAEKSVRAAIKIKKQRNQDSILLGSSYAILGDILEEKGQLEEAGIFFNKSLKIRKKYNDKKGLTTFYKDMGYSLIERGKFKRGVRMLKKGLNLSKKLQLKSHTVLYLGYLVRVYKQHKKYKKALQYYEEFVGMNQELVTESLGRFLTEKEIELEVAQKNKTIETLEINSREFHHRVKNNFQFISGLLSNQYTHTQDDKLKDMIRETEARIQAMTYVHRSLYNKSDSSHIYLKAYIENLVENLILAYEYDEEEIELEVNVADLQIHAEKAMSLGLIVNELVSNAFKHAFPNHPNPTLEVGIALQNHTPKNTPPTIHLFVKDNGLGFDSQQIRVGAFGVNLIHMLCKQLNGKGEYHTEEGTRFDLLINV